MQLNIKKIAISFGNKDVLKDITFGLNFGDKIALVGENGCGKTTLLKIIMKELIPDSGDVYIEENQTIGFLNQDAVKNFDLIAELELIDQKFLSFLNTDLDFENAENLSGGEITKVALCKLLSLNPTILILDEPTNNLDFKGTNTLINLLNMYNGTLIIVSHDRYFLDNLIERVIEIEQGISKEFFGNYTKYKETKTKLFEDSLHRYIENKKEQKRIDDSIKQVKDWSEKAHRDSTKKDKSGLKEGIKEYKRAKAKKMDTHIKSNLKRIEKLRKEGEQRPFEEKNIYFEIKSSATRGKRIIQAIDICKYFGDKLIFDESNFTILRGEKVALFGDNGTGKTTFINMIDKKDTPAKGELWVTTGSEPFIIHQNFEMLNQNVTVSKYFINMLNNFTGGHRTILNNLGIDKNHIEQKLNSLSFGEQMKIKLAEPILKQSDFLILDEPTNHLDIKTKETLEKTLQTYEGTLLIVSHDVELLKKVCDKVLLFKNKRIVKIEDSFLEFFG